MEEKYVFGTKMLKKEDLFYGGDTDAEFIYGVDAVKSDTDNRFHELMEAAIQNGIGDPEFWESIVRG